MIQAVILVQTCALLFGADSYLSDAGQMHSKVVSCAASIRLYEVQHGIRHPGANKAADCHSSWQSWLSTEEKIRTVLALYRRDAELATVYHRPPLLDHRHPRSLSPRLIIFSQHRHRVTGQLHLSEKNREKLLHGQSLPKVRASLLPSQRLVYKVSSLFNESHGSRKSFKQYTRSCCNSLRTFPMICLP